MPSPERREGAPASTAAAGDAPVVSVVMPVYNAEAFVADNVRQLAEYLAAAPRRAELIVVDDGSTDQTVACVRRAIASMLVPARLVSLDHNGGKGAAVRRGMEVARGQYRVFLDADLAYPPGEIEHIVAALANGCDVAIASRVHKDSRYLISPSFFRYLYTRHVAGRFFNWLVRLILLPGIRDSQAGLKGFTATAAEQLFAGWLPTGFSFDLALLFHARRRSMRIQQVPVLYRYDSEPTTVRFLLDTLVVLRDLVQIRLRLAAATVGAGAAAVERQGAGLLRALRSPAAGSALFGTVGLSVITLAVARLALSSGGLALAAWVIALAAFAALALRADGETVPLRFRIFRRRTELALFTVIFAVCAFARLYRLADLPPMIHGDSAECGLLGLALLRGEVADVFDFSPWYQTLYLSFVPYAASFAVTGPTMLGLRLPSAILGIATIVPLYVLVRHWFGARIALLSTALYAVSHAAVHFSRIGLWNIQVLFYAATAFALLVEALRRSSALWATMAGIVSGLALYSYTAGRLVPIIVAVFLGAQLVRRRRRPALRCGAYYGTALLLTIAPIVLNYIRDPSVLTRDRTASVWVLAEATRAHVQATLGTTSPGGVLWQQLVRTLEGFVTIGDTSTQYGTGQPLLSPFTAVLCLVGIFVALHRIREPRHLFLLLWLGLGLVLGSVLVIDPPSYTRLIILLPVPEILAALAVDFGVRSLSGRLSWRGDAAALYFLFLAQAAVFNLVGYYNFVHRMSIMPREWDVLKVVEQLKTDYDYYFFTGPFLLADSPIFQLFSSGTRTVSAFSEVDVPDLLARDSAFVLTPEYRRIGMTISERFPGAEREVTAVDGVRQVIVFRCTVENGCRRGGRS